MHRLRTQQPTSQRLIPGIHRRDSLIEPGDRISEQIGTHQPTALVGGNHCISGSGAVVAENSRYAR